MKSTLLKFEPCELQFCQLLCVLALNVLANKGHRYGCVASVGVSRGWRWGLGVCSLRLLSCLGRVVPNQVALEISRSEVYSGK